MRKYGHLAIAAIAIAASLAACDDDDPTPPQAEQYRATMDGSKETPAVTTPATATGTFTVNGANLDFDITTAGFPAGRTFSGAHIHEDTAVVKGAKSGPVILPFPHTAFVMNGRSTGSVTLDADDLAKIRIPNQTYFNIHTNQFAGGEVRGVLVRVP